MRKFIVLCLGLICLSFSTSVSRQHQISQKPNILLICIDDLRPELGSFGVDYIHSPHIDSLATKGLAFQNHFVNAPSCGPSRYTLLTGLYGPPGNNALFHRAEKHTLKNKTTHPSMPEWFKNQGYTTVSVGKVSHHPGGRGGADWDDSTKIEMPNAWDKHVMPVSEWQHPRGAMHGLAYGEIRSKEKPMDVFQSAEGDDSIYPDGSIAEEGINQLRTLSDHTDKPFFLAIGLLKPHLPFGAPKSYMAYYKDIELRSIPHPEKPQGRTTWHNSSEFNQYNKWGKHPTTNTAFANDVRRHYAACVSYADAQVGKILSELKRTGADKNTIVVLWGDHGWHLGEHGIWGKHSLFEESLRSPLIIYDPRTPPLKPNSNAMVETLDIFPTLCELTGIDTPFFVQGESLKRYFHNLDAPGHNAFAYTSKATTVRNQTHRLILHNDGFIELYDHTTDEAEAKNIASTDPETVKKLKALIESRFKS